jgi:hypothetical protein
MPGFALLQDRIPREISLVICVAGSQRNRLLEFDDRLRVPSWRR